MVLQVEAARLLIDRAASQRGHGAAGPARGVAGQVHRQRDGQAGHRPGHAAARRQRVHRGVRHRAAAPRLARLGAGRRDADHAAHPHRLRAARAADSTSAAERGHRCPTCTSCRSTTCDLQDEARELAARVERFSAKADEVTGRPRHATGAGRQRADRADRAGRVRRPLPDGRLTRRDRRPRGAGERERTPGLAVRDAGHRQLRDRRRRRGAVRQRWLPAVGALDAIAAPGPDRAARRVRPAGVVHHGRAGRRRAGRQRAQVVHHQRRRRGSLLGAGPARRRLHAGWCRLPPPGSRSPGRTRSWPRTCSATWCSPTYACRPTTCSASRARLRGDRRPAGRRRPRPGAVDLAPRCAPAGAGDPSSRTCAFAYDAGTPVLDAVSLHRPRGRPWPWSAPPAAGKTTSSTCSPASTTPTGGRSPCDGHDLRDVRCA